MPIGNFEIGPYLGNCRQYSENKLHFDVEIELIFDLRADISEILHVFQIAIFGHETWPLAKVPEVAHILSFYPKYGSFENRPIARKLLPVERK